jgi:hypothetical protein
VLTFGVVAVFMLHLVIAAIAVYVQCKLVGSREDALLSATEAHPLHFT